MVESKLQWWWSWGCWAHLTLRNSSPMNLIMIMVTEVQGAEIPSVQGKKITMFEASVMYRLAVLT